MQACQAGTMDSERASGVSNSVIALLMRSPIANRIFVMLKGESNIMKRTEMIINKTDMMKREPDMDTAISWYPRMKNQYAPLGWKDCLFEYLITWNGDIVVPTDVLIKQGLEKYHDADAQFAFFWQVGDMMNCSGNKLHDNEPCQQSYLDEWKPCVVTEKYTQGLEIIETAFAYTPGFCDLTAGDESLYLWVSFDVSKAIEVLVPEDDVTLYIQVTSHRLRNSMEAGNNSFNIEPAEPYVHKLVAAGNMLLQDDGSVRMAVSEDSVITYHEFWGNAPWATKSRSNVVEIKLRLQQGNAHCQLLIPMLPVSEQDMLLQMEMGYDAALKRSMKFWEEESAKGVKLDISESIPLNTFRSNHWRMLTIAERNPVFNQYILNNGAFSYDALWPTPSCMSLVWGLDYMGFHKDAERYLDVYLRDQGNTNPPGIYYIKHPGFLSAPESFVAIRWVNEHGAVMWAAAEHYLLTRDDQFLKKWLPALIIACEWIAVQRRCVEHPGEKGIIPPGSATDDAIPGQFIWSDGWLYKGLVTVVRVLEGIGHSEANRWRREAEEYKQKFNELFSKACTTAPRWKATDGREYPFIPTEITGKLPERNRHAFYLDAGVLSLAFSGILEPDNAAFDAVLKWFREGPQTKYWRFDGCCWQTPVLHHEMSSCEPCYSWNMEVNFQREDREHFIEGLYAQFAGARTTDLFSDIETRNGMFATCFTTPVTFHHFRNALVYENGNTLELLRMAPAAWFKPGDTLELNSLPTYFGPMDLKVYCDDSGRKVELYAKLPCRNAPTKMVLYIPPFLMADTAVVNGMVQVIEGNKIQLWDLDGSIKVELIRT